MDDPIRIFVGCAANDEDLESQVVFEYTLRRFSSRHIQITWMKLSRDPASPFYSSPETKGGWRTRRWATPFSAFRWAIPALCDFEGRAIYFDSDFIFCADVGELWDSDIPEGKTALAKDPSRFCCTLWDNARAKNHLTTAGYSTLEALQADADAHNKLGLYFHKRRDILAPFGQLSDWNVLDIGLPADLATPRIKAIHYTQMPTQPQLRYAIPRLRAEGRQHWYTNPIKTPHPRADLQALFDKEYENALRSGMRIDTYKSAPLYGPYEIRGLPARISIVA